MSLLFSQGIKEGNRAKEKAASSELDGRERKQRFAAAAPGRGLNGAMTASKFMIQQIAQGNFKGKFSAKLVPLCNTGRPKGFGRGVEISIRPDEIKLSVHMSELIKAGMDPFDLFFVLCIRAWVGNPAVKGCSMSTRETLLPGLHGYETRAVLTRGDKCLADVQWGGVHQKGWVQIHVHGGLCKLLKPSHWRGLYAMAKRLNARLNAIDIAGDDLHGDLGIHPMQVRRHLDKNNRAFMPGHLVKGRAPELHRWYEERGACTAYIGGQRSSIRHRIYEKGKEQGDKLHPDWHRWEVMFRRTDKTDLSLDLIRPCNWASAWLGSCKWLAKKFQESGAKFVSKVESVQRMAQEKAARAVLQIEKQYGGVIGHLHRVLGSQELIRLLERSSADPDLCDLTSEDTRDILELIDLIKKRHALPSKFREKKRA